MGGGGGGNRSFHSESAAAVAQCVTARLGPHEAAAAAAAAARRRREESAFTPGPRPNCQTLLLSHPVEGGASPSPSRSLHSFQAPILSSDRRSRRISMLALYCNRLKGFAIRMRSKREKILILSSHFHAFIFGAIKKAFRGCSGFSYITTSLETATLQRMLAGRQDISPLARSADFRGAFLHKLGGKGWLGVGLDASISLVYMKWDGRRRRHMCCSPFAVVLRGKEFITFETHVCYSSFDFFTYTT